jgi:hypothetical protein
MILPASKREQAIFTRWLEWEVYRKRQMSAMGAPWRRLEVVQRVLRISVHGRYPACDTVTGSRSDLEREEQRDEPRAVVYKPNPGNLNAGPGRQHTTREQEGPPLT